MGGCTNGQREDKNQKKRQQEMEKERTVMHTEERTKIEEAKSNEWTETQQKYTGWTVALHKLKSMNN